MTKAFYQPSPDGCPIEVVIICLNQEKQTVLIETPDANKPFYFGQIPYPISAKFAIVPSKDVFLIPEKQCKR